MSFPYNNVPFAFKSTTPTKRNITGRDLARAEIPEMVQHPLIDLDEAMAPSLEGKLPYVNAPSLMPELVKRHSSRASLTMEKAAGFAEATEKLDAIAEFAERIYAQFREGASIRKNMILPAELEKLCNVMARVRYDEYRGIDAACQRQIVANLKWEAVVKALTHLVYPLRELPRDHPNRSKFIKDKMVRVLEWLETETENVQFAVEVFVGSEVEVGGKKYGKGSHLVTQISRVLDTWKEL